MRRERAARRRVRDVERSVTLVFNSRRVTPQRLVQIDATHPSGGGSPPARMSLRLRRADNSFVTWFHTGSTELFYESGSGTTRLAGWFDDAPYDRPTANSYTAIVTSYFDDGVRGPASAQVAVRVLSSYSYTAAPYGYGWAIGNVDMLHPADGGQVLASGDGSASYFGPCVSGCTPYTYVSPAGDASILRRPQISATRWFERTFPDESVAEYDDGGRLRKVRDRFGNATTYLYDGATTRLASITDPAGKVTTLHYDASGHLTRITDPGARHSHVTIDAGGRVTQIQRPDGQYALRVDAYANRAPLSWRDADGGQWDWAWDGYGNPHQLQAPAVAIHGAGTQRPTSSHLSYENALFAALTNGRGTSSDPGARLVPGAPNLRAIVVNPRGHHTYVTLDRWGAATMVEEPLGRVTMTRRDTLGRVVRTQSASGHVVRYTYDPTAATRYNLIQVHDSTRHVQQHYAYVPGTAYLHHTSGGLEPEAWYNWSSDAHPRRLLSTRSGTSNNTSGPATYYGYSTTSAGHITGRVNRVTDREGHNTVMRFASAAAFGNTDRIADSTSTATQVRMLETRTHDGLGRVLTSTNGDGETSRLAYDLLNRVTTTVGAAGDSTRIHHGAFETRVADAVGSVYRTYLNALGWATHETDPYGNSTLYAHDANGNVVSRTKRDGGVTTFAYDALDQPTLLVAGIDTTTFHFAPSGDSVKTRNGESEDVLYFDKLGRDTLEVSLRPGGDLHQIRKTYTALGQKDTVWYKRPWWSWQALAAHQFDATGRPTAIRDVSGAWTHLEYDDDGLVERTRLPYHPAGSGMTSAYSGIHRPSATTFGGGVGDAHVLDRKYGYDAAGRLNARLLHTNVESGREFRFDSQGRLSWHADFGPDGSGDPCTPVYSGGRLEPIGDEQPVEYPCPDGRAYGDQLTYQYDAVGNPTSGWKGAALTRNRLDSLGGWRLLHDLEGNLTQRDSGSIIEQFSWSVDGKLQGFYSNRTTPAGWTLYRYDGRGRRVRVVHPDGVTRHLVYDGAHINTEWSTIDNLPRFYSYYPGVDRPHALWQANQMFYYIQDADGNVVALTDATGAVVNRYRYSPFGTLEDSLTELVPNRLRFKGREFDVESGLYHMRARYYDPRLQRFISEDPIGLAGGINPYVFAGNDPVNYRDPSGMARECISWWTRGTRVSSTMNGVTFEVVTPGFTSTVCLDRVDFGGGGGGYYAEGGGGSAGGGWRTSLPPPAPSTPQFIAACFEQNKLSHKLFGGTRFEEIAGVVEVGSEFSLLLDLLALDKKMSRGSGLGGFGKPYASGMNRLSRAAVRPFTRNGVRGSGRVLTALLWFGDRATVPTAAIGATSGAFNAGVLARCGLEAIR